MMEAMILVGAEDVRHGGNACREAGDDMQGAASRIKFALEQHQRFLDDWLARFQDALTTQPTAKVR